MSTPPTTVEVGNFTVTSTSATEDQIREEMGEPEAVSKAAAELGKKGGEASAAKRAAEAKEKPEPKEAKPKAEEDEPEPPAEEDDEPESGGEGVKLGKPRHDPKARMLEATRKEAEAKRERDAAKAEADTARRERDALRAEVEAAKVMARPAEKAPASTDGEPKEDDFPSYTDYVKAASRYEAQQFWKAEKEKEARDTEHRKSLEDIDRSLKQSSLARKEYAKTDGTWLEKVSEEVKAIANMPSIAVDREKVGADHIIADEIIIADEKDPSKAIGPRLMLHFTDHPEDLQRIRALRTYQAVQVEMRVLARSLNGAVTAGAAPKAISKASPPLRPVSGSPNTAESDEMDDDTPLAERVQRWNRRELRSQR